MSRLRPRRIVAAIGVLIVAVLALGVGYLAIPQPLLPEATAALTSTAGAEYALEGDRLLFRPRDATPDTGFIVYPGGKVPAAAYAPLALAIASKGFLVEIVPMPLNLAVLGIDKGRDVIAAHPEIRHWAIGGHSLGGSMAAQLAADEPRIEGLVMWAAYSATDLSASDVRVLVVYGSLDGGAAGFASPQRLANLPPNPTIVVIQGGNHEQMGWYSGQPNDPPATIDRAAQQAQVVQVTVELLERLGA